MKNALQAVILFAVALVGTSCDSNPGRVDAAIFTDTFTFDPSRAEVNGMVISQQFDAPAITPDVADYGAVLVYFWSQETWTAMPYTYLAVPADSTKPDVAVTLGFAYDTGFLEVFYELSAPPSAVKTLPGATRMKMVVISEMPAGKNAPDLSSYEQVARYYGLQD